MKKISFLLLSLTALLLFYNGCKDDEGPILPDRLVIVASGETITNPGKVIRFSANMDVDWYVEDPTGGAISDDGIYTAPNNFGTFIIRAVSKEDPNITDTEKVIITDFVEEIKQILEGNLVAYFHHALADSGSDDPSVSGRWWEMCIADTTEHIETISRVLLSPAFVKIKVLLYTIFNQIV